MPDPVSSSPPLSLWGIGTGRTLRPIWMFHELGIDFDHQPIVTRTAKMVEPAFKTLSGRGKIPLLSDGDFVLGESAAITLYLADRFRDQGVFAPEPGTPARALHDELCWFAMTEVDAILYVIRRHDGLPEIYGASEVAVQAAREYTLKSLGEFERRLVDGRSHLLGGEFTVADLLLKTCLDWAAFVYQMPLPDLLVAYSLRVAERPAYAKAMQQNFPPEIMNQLVGDKDA